MALNYIAPEIGVPLTKGVSVVKGTIGEKNYGKTRKAMTRTYGILNGFSPIPPMMPLLPVKIAVFIVLLLLCLYVLGMSGGKAFVGAYLGQALIIMYLSEQILDKTLSWGFGV